MNGNATFATIEEAWGPAAQLASVPPNPYQNPAYQRSVLDSAAATGIVPREPQVVEASLVRAYLAKLYADSGPMAVSALLPPEFAAPAPRRRQTCGWDGLWNALTDPENFFAVVLAAFALLLMVDAFKK
jgi:hypothetical protein